MMDYTPGKMPAANVAVLDDMLMELYRKVLKHSHRRNRISDPSDCDLCIVRDRLFLAIVYVRQTAHN